MEDAPAPIKQAHRYHFHQSSLLIEAESHVLVRILCNPRLGNESVIPCRSHVFFLQLRVPLHDPRVDEQLWGTACPSVFVLQNYTPSLTLLQVLSLTNSLHYCFFCATSSCVSRMRSKTKRAAEPSPRSPFVLRIPSSPPFFAAGDASWALRSSHWRGPEPARHPLACRMPDLSTTYATGSPGTHDRLAPELPEPQPPRLLGASS